jgi:hypothetical protein
MVVVGGSDQPATSIHSAPVRGVTMELREAGLTWHVVGDDVVVLDLEKSTYLKLNGTAKLLWERLTTCSTEVELTALLVERFGIADERATDDVAAFLSDLRERDLLVG